jgi:hypothetical protein
MLSILCHFHGLALGAGSECEVAEIPVFRGLWRRERPALQLAVLLARGETETVEERTSFTENAGVLPKVIDQHDVAARIAKL